jgi:hypothetical protein
MSVPGTMPTYQHVRDQVRFQGLNGPSSGHARRTAQDPGCVKTHTSASKLPLFPLFWASDSY